MSKSVAIIGAGVVGLTTALKVQEKGYPVTIIAKHQPGDEHIEYTSPWAGAHHLSFAHGDEKRKTIDKETFDIMWEMSEPGHPAENCFKRMYQEEDLRYEDWTGRPDCLDMMPNYRQLSPEEVTPPATSGISFTTLSIDVPVYLNYLLTLFTSRGGQIIKADVQHITQVIDGAFSASPDALIVSPGLGARSLGGVEDKNMWPGRGQTVLIKAPWVQHGRTYRGEHDTTYMIPRKSGNVIIGGTVDNDWFPNPRPETTLRILERNLKMSPELVLGDPDRKGDHPPTLDELKALVIGEGCGLRPFRTGGYRLESEVLERSGRKVPVVFNYGHGGEGYQSSWGTARIATELLEEAFKAV